MKALPPGVILSEAKDLPVRVAATARRRFFLAPLLRMTYRGDFINDMSCFVTAFYF
jgi:hypothetical protein